MKDHEREWLAEHLGHTLDMHKSHYRLQEPLVEMTQLTKLLMAVEEGRASEFVGKSLATIRIPGINRLYFLCDVTFLWRCCLSNVISSVNLSCC